MLEILVSPKSVSVIDGDGATFHCIAKADEVIFFVNDTPADGQVVVNKGFIESTITEINETTRERTLSATASIQYNNTSIICRALSSVSIINVKAVLSDPALLLIKGKITFSILLAIR